MPGSNSLMFAEAKSVAGLIEQQRASNAHTVGRLVAALRISPPHFVVTLARGSSDNAATYARYLIERRLNLLTGSLAPSVSSIYETPLQFRGQLLIAISQSGRSPDIVGTARRARDQGACVVAVVNDPGSPLAHEADYCLHIAAGPEHSVAATKTFMLSVTAMLDFVATWAGDDRLSKHLSDIGSQLAASWELDWSAALAPLTGASSAFIVARGHALGVAQEVALKLKETCSLHAEAISAAEIRHGPMALVGPGFPVIFLGQSDQSQAATLELAKEFSARGARVMQSGLGEPIGTVLPHVDADAAVVPLLQLQSFYRLCERLARVRGLDPDRPPHLNKVTQTV